MFESTEAEYWTLIANSTSSAPNAHHMVLPSESIVVLFVCKGLRPTAGNLLAFLIIASILRLHSSCCLSEKGRFLGRQPHSTYNKTHQVSCIHSVVPKKLPEPVPTRVLKGIAWRREPFCCPSQPYQLEAAKNVLAPRVA